MCLRVNVICNIFRVRQLNIHYLSITAKKYKDDVGLLHYKLVI